MLKDETGEQICANSDSGLMLHRIVFLPKRSGGFEWSLDAERRFLERRSSHYSILITTACECEKPTLLVSFLGRSHQQPTVILEALDELRCAMRLS